MRVQGYGRIVQNSSVLGFVASPFRGAYTSTKYALEALSDTLRLELANTNIKVVLIEPGPIRTKFRQNCYPHFKQWINWQGSVLAPIYKHQVIPRLQAVNPPPELFELGPRAVSKAVLHACESPKPRSRYRITKATIIAAWIKRLLPTRGVDLLLKRMSGLPKSKV